MVQLKRPGTRGGPQLQRGKNDSCYFIQLHVVIFPFYILFSRDVIYEYQNKGMTAVCLLFVLFSAPRDFPLVIPLVFPSTRKQIPPNCDLFKVKCKNPFNVPGYSVCKHSSKGDDSFIGASASGRVRRLRRDPVSGEIFLCGSNIPVLVK